MPDDPVRRLPRVAYLLFFASGAAGLIDEISWSRQIGLVFGHSGHTAAVVLGSYFGGMAIGYALAARWVSRVAPLRGYALAEILVAAWAALVPSLLDGFQAVAPAGLVDHPSPTIRTAARAAIGLVALLPASIALGATLPFLAQAIDPEGREGDSRRVALAYAINTLGALVGVVAATSVLLLIVGVRGSGYLAAGISGLCGLVALALPGGSPAPTDRENGADPDRGEAAFWAFTVAVAGFGTLALEVLFTRMFALVFHNSTYTFGLVVAFFLLALAVGSAGVARRRGDPERVAGWAALIGSALVAVAVAGFAWITKLDYFGGTGSFATYLGMASILVGAVVVPPVALLGSILPASWAAAGRKGVATGRVVGRLTAANTVAAAIGSLAASFLLVPAVGLWDAFACVAGLFALLGGVLLARAGQRLAAMVGVPLVAAAVALGVNVPRDIDTAPPGGEILRSWEGPYGLVDVVRKRTTGELTIRQNLHYGLGSSTAAGRELIQGHLPLLLHPNPKDILFLGVGTGMTAASALRHPEVASIVAVELNPDVVAAARLYLGDANQGVLDDPRVEVVVDDARHYLASTDRKFDAIISDLFVPWESQTGYLYTVELDRAARAHLKPGGVFCQWLAMYQVGERELETIADSVASVFPVTFLWWGQVDPNLSFLALIGTEAPIKLDRDVLADRLASLRTGGSESDAYLLQSPASFLLHHAGRWTVRDPSRLNTDEHPRIEFLAPLTHRDREILTGSALRSFQTRVLSRLPQDDIHVTEPTDPPHP